MTDVWVWEVFLEDFPDWDGDQLYDELLYAKFCAEQDYKETIVSSRDKPFTWEQVTREYWHMYLDDVPTGVAIRKRPVYSQKV